jgi:hypothetical protein
LTSNFLYGIILILIFKKGDSDVSSSNRRDYVDHIKGTLFSLGANDIEHWDARGKDITRKKIPEKTECVVFLTSYLNHNAMNHFKKEAAKRNLKTIYAKRSVSCVYEEYCKAFGKPDFEERCSCKNECRKDKKWN